MIKNDYAMNASVDSKINDMKAQHIADEVKKVDASLKRMLAIFSGLKIDSSKKKTLLMRTREDLVLIEGFSITLIKVI